MVDRCGTIVRKTARHVGMLSVSWEERQQASQTRGNKSVAGVPPIVNIETNGLGRIWPNAYTREAITPTGQSSSTDPMGSTGVDHVFVVSGAAVVATQAVADYFLGSIALRTKSSS